MNKQKIVIQIGDFKMEIETPEGKTEIKGISETDTKKGNVQATLTGENLPFNPLIAEVPDYMQVGAFSFPNSQAKILNFTATATQTIPIEKIAPECIDINILFSGEYHTVQATKTGETQDNGNGTKTTKYMASVNFPLSAVDYIYDVKTKKYNVYIMSSTALSVENSEFNVLKEAQKWQ